MWGRQPPPYRNKKLVRSRRLSHADSSDESVAGGEDPATTPSHHAAVAGDAGPAHSSGPASRWKRASVKAVELQEWRKVAKSPSRSNGSLLPTTDPFPPDVKLAWEPAAEEGPSSSSTSEPRVTVHCDSSVYYEPLDRKGAASAVKISQDFFFRDPPKEGDVSNHGSETESNRSNNSSLLVDMGKVVGVLRGYPGPDSEDDHSDYDLEEEPEVCLSCEAEAQGYPHIDEEEDFGDPLVYATFVAPIHQYSTETEYSRQTSVHSRQPSVNSRQPSVNSRQPSFNSRQHSVNSNKNSANSRQPSFNSGQQVVNSRQPSVNSNHPSVSSRQPSVNSSQCSPNSRQPSVNSSQHSPNSRQPSVNSSQHSPNSRQPSVNSSQHSPNSRQPSVNARQPSVNSNQRSVNSRQPSVNSRQPSVNSNQPAVISGQPSFNSRQPSSQQNSTEAEQQFEVAGGQNSLLVPGQLTKQLLQVPGHSPSPGPGASPAPDPQSGQLLQVPGHPDTNHTGSSEPQDCTAVSGMDGWDEGPPISDCLRRCEPPPEHWGPPGPEQQHCGGGHPYGEAVEQYDGADPDFVTSAELNDQVSQERLSFIHSQSSREDDPDYDNLPLPAPPPPPQQVPLPIPPPPKTTLSSLRQESNQNWGSGEESDNGVGGTATEINADTIRRKTKRDRNKTATTTAGERVCLGSHHHHHHHASTGNGGTSNPAVQASNCGAGSLGRQSNKSRSKSRSPGREIDRAIVIVHHTTCTHQTVRSRGASPDNLSESSISFHENEVMSDISPNPAVPRVPEPPPVWYDGPMDPCVSVSRDPLPMVRGSGDRVLQYSNWESCRESWFSSGSDCPRPSSGSDNPPQPSFLRDKDVGRGIPAPPSTLPRVGGRGGGASTAPLTNTMRQSSRESGSSSSRHSSRPNTRTNNRSRSPGTCKQGVSGKVVNKYDPSRDSTPTESGGSSLHSGPSLQRLDLDQVVGVGDLVYLDPLTEENIIENLNARFKHDQIYSWSSTVLLSVNSYKKLSLYTPEVIDAYRCGTVSQLPPHIYSLADRAWRTLRDRGEDQAVILTGESGAGKTEAGKLVLQYIAAVTHHSSEFHDIKYQLLQSNPVLEAFGNARTIHNDNSSRFGKYIEVSFDFKGDPTGGNITNYLLEKTRVTSFCSEERNFHIFYQLLAGADINTLKELKLQRNLDSYRLLASSKSSSSQQQTTAGKPVNSADRRDFHITKKALEDLGLRSEEISMILRLVASVLKLGNLDFVPTTNMDGTEGSTIGNEYELYEAAGILGADANLLRSALLARSVILGSDTVISEVSADEASEGRDRLCRTMYSRLFTWLVSRINQAIKVKTHKKHKVLGILDIYGFEAFQENGFEQFIINFANEKLQQVFIDSTFRREQVEAISEGIQWNQIGYFSNCVICSLIERNTRGILAQLDQASNKLGNCEGVNGNGASLEASDQQFLEGLDETFRCHPHYEASSSPSPSPQENPVPAHSFRIKHYAGSVTYSVTGFLAKNCDWLDPALSRTIYLSSHPLAQTLFPEGNCKRGVRRRPATVGTQFKISLGALLNNLGSKSPHFVRCIKPNETKTPRLFDPTLVQHQIRYLGIMEFVRLRVAGFVLRDTYEGFLHRFKMLSTHTWPSWQGPAVEGVTYLLRELPLSASEYVFGRSKIFIKSWGSVEALEEWRRERVDELVVNIQKVWKGWVARRNWSRLRDSQIVISTYWKRWKDKSHVTELKQRRKQEWAVIILQKHYRFWQRKRWLVHLAHSLPSESPSSRDWPRAPSCLRDTSFLLRKLYHRWRCERFRERFDQTSRNRMREKVTASLIFKDKKSSYPKSICHPFLGDYVRLRQNPQWKKICGETNDQYVVFADIINKITRTNGKFVPILFVISTSSMLILDQRTMQIKYRVPAGEILKLSLSPFFDDIAVFHVRSGSPTRELRSQANIPSCLSSEAVARKGDFVFQTGHVIEIVTKLFLVVQNATGKPPAVNIGTQFDANFGTHSVTFQFKCGTDPNITPGHVKLLKKGDKMEVIL